MRKTLLLALYILIIPVLSWAGPTITNVGVGAVNTIKEDTAATTVALTTNQCSGGQINNSGQATANVNWTIPIPAVVTGMHFTVILTDTVAKFFLLDPDASDYVWLNGVVGTQGKGVQITSAVQGAAIQFKAFQTGAATWAWYAVTVSGPWIVEP